MFCDIQLFSSNCNRILQVPKRGKHLSWIVFLRLQIGINNICNFAWQILRLSRQIKWKIWKLQIKKYSWRQNLWDPLVFVNFSAQDASILKISVPISKRRSWGFQNTPNLQSSDYFEPSYGTSKKAMFWLPFSNLQSKLFWETFIFFKLP